ARCRPRTSPAATGTTAPARPPAGGRAKRSAPPPRLARRAAPPRPAPPEPSPPPSAPILGLPRARCGTSKVVQHADDRPDKMKMSVPLGSAGLAPASGHFGPRVAQANRAVEHGPPGLAVRVATKIALPLELDGIV